MAERTPSDLARDTLKQLAARRLPPTPEHYQAVYEEVAGLLPQEHFPQRHLRHIHSILPSQTPAQKQLAQALSQAIEQQDWQALQQSLVGYAQQIQPLVHEPLPPTTSADVLTVLPAALAEQLARTIEHTAASLGQDDARMQELALQLAAFLRASPPPLAGLLQMLQNYGYRLSFTAADQAQRQHSIRDLLRLVLTHITQLSHNDPGLQAQALQLEQSLQVPWTLTQLGQLQEQFKHLLLRRTELHGRAQEAEARIKQLLNDYLERLAVLSQHSEAHSQKVEHCIARMGQVQNLHDLAPVLESLLSASRALATDNRLVQAELSGLREQAVAERQAVAQLQQALDEAQDVARHDTATGALNSRGLQEQLERELSRAQRHQSPLSLAMLDLDDFEVLAQQAPGRGPQLLRHLAQVAHAILRPQDQLAHLEGGRFVLLLPAIQADQAVQAMARFLTELGRRPLLLEDRQQPLAFSAAALQLALDESPEQVLARAAAGVELAQRLGRNRVVRA